MRVAIHQPQYFPWIGYFDKMGKSDLFVFLDQVQLVRGRMNRNVVLDQNGQPQHITIVGDTKSSPEREFRSIRTKHVEEWTSRQFNALESYYKKAPFRDEILGVLQTFFSQRYETVCQWSCASIELVRNILEIKTPIAYQSDLEYSRSSQKSDLIYAICKTVNADVYLSGRGASVEYLDREKFAAGQVQIAFQDFQHPVYRQCSSQEFVPGISTLDMLFNWGNEDSRRIFWENLHGTHEFEGIG